MTYFMKSILLTSGKLFKWVIKMINHSLYNDFISRPMLVGNIIHHERSRKFSNKHVTTGWSMLWFWCQPCFTALWQMDLTRAWLIAVLLLSLPTTQIRKVNNNNSYYYYSSFMSASDLLVYVLTTK